MPAKGRHVSIQNVRRSIQHLLPPPVKKANVMNISRNTRASIPRSAKSAYQARRNMERIAKEIEREEKEQEKEVRKERSEKKAAHVSAMSNLNAMLSKMHF
jgi:hypothetical protein